jgi:hypothetical protein
MLKNWPRDWEKPLWVLAEHHYMSLIEMMWYESSGSGGRNIFLTAGKIPSRKVRRLALHSQCVVSCEVRCDGSFRKAKKQASSGSRRSTDNSMQ